MHPSSPGPFGPDPAPPSGGALSRLGPYRLLHELGRGAMSAVYLARRDGLERSFALKVLLDGQRDPDALRRFELEARVMSKLQHPGLVPVLDAGQDGGRRYLVMELVRGPTLAAHLAQRGALPALEAAALVQQLAEAVACAHAAGIVHRDLKPANVLIDERTGRPRVADFGLARAPDLVETLTRTGDTVGTPLYMPPEQFRGGQCDARADVWALGVILFECLSGRRPFSGQSYLEVAQAVRSQRLFAPRSPFGPLPAGLDAVCLRALERDLERRTPSAAALAAELGEVLTRAGARDRLGATERTRPRASRGRAGLLAGALLAGGAGLAGALLTSSWLSDRAPGTIEAGGLPEPVATPAASPAAPEDPAARSAGLLARCDQASCQGRWEESIAAADELIALDPRGRPAQEARLIRAFALIRAERSAEGFQALTDLHQDDPTGPVGLTALASRQIFEGDMQALELTERALSLDPRYFQARITRAHALLNAGRTDEAEALLLATLPERRADPRLHYYLGRVRSSLNDHAGALEAYDETARLVAPHAWRLLQQYRINSLTALGRLPEAVALLDELLTSHPRDQGSRFLRGLLRWRMGDLTRAGEDWRAARDVDPDGFAATLDQLVPEVRQAVEAGLAGPPR